MRGGGDRAAATVLQHRSLHVTLVLWKTLLASSLSNRCATATRCAADDLAATHWLY